MASMEQHCRLHALEPGGLDDLLSAEGIDGALETLEARRLLPPRLIPWFCAQQSGFDVYGGIHER